MGGQAHVLDRVLGIGQPAIETFLGLVEIWQLHDSSLVGCSSLLHTVHVHVWDGWYVWVKGMNVLPGRLGIQEQPFIEPTVAELSGTPELLTHTQAHDSICTEYSTFLRCAVQLLFDSRCDEVSVNVSDMMLVPIVCKD